MNYYLVYWIGDGGDNESYSVFYTRLTQAKDEDEAWKNVLPTIKKEDDTNPNREYYGIKKIKLI